MPFDPQLIISDFPILTKKIHGDKHLAYLDNAATSHKPNSVIDAISNYYREHNANVHRGIHQLGDESTKLFHQSRAKIAAFFGADVEEFLVVRNTTEALNQIAYTWGEKWIEEGDLLLSTELEHHSNIVPWQELALRKNAEFALVKCSSEGCIDLDSLTSFLKTGKVKLVSFTHVSNVLGTLIDLEKIVSIIHHFSPGTKIVVDGAQAAPHLPVDFHQLNVDFYVVSAHKMLGPMGIGGLFVRHSLLEKLPPFLFGGGMIDQVSEAKTTFAENLEERFTAGTPDVASLVGWAAACDYLSRIGMKQLLEHDRALVSYTIKKLRAFPQISIVGITKDSELDERVGSVAFIYDGVHAHDVGQILDSEGVAVRSGHHCAMPLHRKFGWQATVRVSFQLYNTTTDIDQFITALKKVKTVFGK